MKKYLILVFILLASFTNAEVKNNNVYFQGAKIKSLDYLGHSIESTQKFIGLTYTHGSDKDMASIDILASRKNSIEPVRWVNSEMEKTIVNPWRKENMVSTIASGDQTPKKLNFAVKVNLQLVIGIETYTCNNILLGQGSISPGINNWWFFSNRFNFDENLNNSIKINCYPLGGDPLNPVSIIVSPVYNTIHHNMFKFEVI